MMENLNHPVAQRLAAPGPKRILALDGGGIRGAITLGFLVRLEEQLQRRHANPDLLLRDYFDFIGGTSTGSIIAASLAIGMRAKDVLTEYGKMGDQIFEHPAKFWQIPKWFRQNLFYKNAPKAIEGILQQFYTDKATGREYTLGDTALSGGLCIVTKRVDTFSVWPMHNNPNGKFYHDNKDLPLWRVVRASSAAPTFFPPTIFSFDKSGKEGAFVDGGVSMYNNPAMLLYLIATLKGYRMEWPTGADKLMVVSIGTGTSEVRYTPEEVRKLGKKSAIFWGSTVPDMFLRDATEYNEMLLQSMSESPTARQIDGEVGDLAGDQLGGTAKLHYLRYNAVISKEDVAAGAKLTRQDPKMFPPVHTVASMMQMDRGDHVFHLTEIGKRAAASALGDAEFEAQFPKVFDIKP